MVDLWNAFFEKRVFLEKSAEQRESNETHPNTLLMIDLWDTFFEKGGFFF